MVLYISYEEVRAVRLGARSVLGDETHGMCAVAAAPPPPLAQRSAPSKSAWSGTWTSTLLPSSALWFWHCHQSWSAYVLRWRPWSARRIPPMRAP